MTEEKRPYPNLDVALQEIGDALSLLGRLRLAGPGLDGLAWGQCVNLLQNACLRVRACTPGLTAAPEGSKLNPGVEDCYTEALPDEPLFVLLARDPQAPKLVREWAAGRASLIAHGDKPADDVDKTTRAMALATKMELWRNERLGAWRSNAEEELPAETLAEEVQAVVAVENTAEAAK